MHVTLEVFILPSVVMGASDASGSLSSFEVVFSSVANNSKLEVDTL